MSDYDYDNAMDQLAEREEEERYEEYMMEQLTVNEEKVYEEYMEYLLRIESEEREERFKSRYRSGYLTYIYYIIEDLFNYFLSFCSKRKIM